MQIQRKGWIFAVKMVIELKKVKFLKELQKFKVLHFESLKTIQIVFICKMEIIRQGVPKNE